MEAFEQKKERNENFIADNVQLYHCHKWEWTQVQTPWITNKKGDLKRLLSSLTMNYLASKVAKRSTYTHHFSHENVELQYILFFNRQLSVWQCLLPWFSIDEHQCHRDKSNCQNLQQNNDIGIKQVAMEKTELYMDISCKYNITCNSR